MKNCFISIGNSIMGELADTWQKGFYSQHEVRVIRLPADIQSFFPA